MTGRWQIIHADALDALRNISPGSVDLVLTDPPYSSGGLTRGDRMSLTTSKYTDQSNSGAAALAAFAGDNRDQRGWLHWSALWLGLCLRAAKPGALLACFVDWRQLPTLTDAVQAGGWVWRGVSAWDKPDARPQLGRPAQSCEFVVWATAGARAVGGDQGPRTYSGVAPRVREHQTQKPIAMLQQWVDLAPRGGLVLDPFAGSGTTGEAALLNGRRFIGIEVTDHYAEVARRRLGSMDEVGARETDLQPTLFGEAAS